MNDTVSISNFRKIFGENVFRSTSEEYYDWKIFRNPYHKGKTFLERKEGMVVGSFTITPKKISIHGKELLAAETGDAFTHSQFRRRGISTKLRISSTKFALNEGIQVVYGIPNSQSLSVSKKTDRLPCPFVRLSLMTKPLRILRTIVISIINLSLGRKLDSSFSFLFTMLMKKFYRSIFPRLKSISTNESFNIFTLDKFTDEIDGLWGSQRYIFFTIRDKTYLNWRYFENPDKYQIIVAKSGNEYLGYVVTKISKSGKAASICDFITVDDRLDVFNALIQKAEDILRKAGVLWIQLWCVDDSPYYQALLGQAYYDQGLAFRQPVVVFSGTDYGKKLLEEDGKWHFTMSDSDHI